MRLFASFQPLNRKCSIPRYLVMADLSLSAGRARCNAPPAPAARAFLFMQKAPGSCAFAEWLGRGFGNCGSYDDCGARGRAGAAGGVGGDVVDGVGLAVIEPQQKRWRLRLLTFPAHSLALRPARRSCLRLTHVVASMRPRLDSRWGRLVPLSEAGISPAGSIRLFLTHHIDDVVRRGSDCHSAWGPDADRRHKPLIQLTAWGSHPHA